MEYTAVLPVSDFGLGLFLRDEPGNRVVIGGFRSPKQQQQLPHLPQGLQSQQAVNPSVRAGIKIGDALLRVNNVPVTRCVA